MEPKNIAVSFGIKINEYAFELAKYASLSSPPNTIFSAHTFLSQSKYATDNNPGDSLRSGDKFELSIRKSNNVVYVSFENNLKLCIPIDNKLAMNGYAVFEREDAYAIRVYSRKAK